MADVKPDAGAGVGKSGVVTPWENGNLGKGNGDWTTRPRTSTDPEDRNENRKNGAGTGKEWEHPWQGPSMELGKLGAPGQNSSTPQSGG